MLGMDWDHQCVNPRQVGGPVQSCLWQGPDRITMTSAAGKWHQHDMHVWLRSARAASPGLELHSLDKQRWFLSPTQDQHMPGTQSKAFTASQEVKNKQQAQTPPGLHAGWILPHHTAVCRQLCAGSGVWEGRMLTACRPKGSFPRNSPATHRYLPASSAAGQLSGCLHSAH